MSDNRTSDELSDYRTRKPQGYWCAALLDKAAKGKLPPPQNDEERGKLLELRTLIDGMLGE